MAESRRIRVAEVIDDAAVGGGQRHVCDLATRLDRSRFECAVLCEGRGWLVDQLARHGMGVRPVRMTNRPDPGALRAVSRHLAEFGADVVHTHGGTAGFYGRWAASRLRLRTVHTYHGLHSLRASGLRAACLRSIDRFLAVRTDRLICVSEGDLALARRHGLAPPRRTTLVPNGIDMAAYAGAAGNRPDGKRTQEFVIGTVGRLSPEKGHVDLLEAARLVREQAPSARFRIIGEGEERPRLEARRRELGLEGIFELPGSRYDMTAVLSELDLFVLPSLWEGHPIALLEALVAGLPVIASDIDGVRAILGDTEDAILVPSRDPAALAAAILRLVGDPGRREAMARAGRAVVRDRFDLNTTVRAIEAIYEEVAA